LSSREATGTSFVVASRRSVACDEPEQEIIMRLPMTAAFAAVAVLASLATLPSAWAADGEANKKLVRALIEEVMNKRQPAAVDRFLATDFIEHNPNLPQGRDGRKQFVAAVLAGFSDYRGEIVEILAEGDKVVVRTQWSGTQDGPFLGLPPSGNKVRFSTADFFRIEGGKVAEHWDVVDSLPRAVALGLVPPPKVPTQVVPPKAP
jgi:predicted SnoaL-like aldol condensation-catalyzing enzyme